MNGPPPRAPEVLRIRTVARRRRKPPRFSYPTPGGARQRDGASCHQIGACGGLSLSRAGGGGGVLGGAGAGVDRLLADEHRVVPQAVTLRVIGRYRLAPRLGGHGEAGAAQAVEQVAAVEAEVVELAEAALALGSVGQRGVGIGL